MKRTRALGSTVVGTVVLVLVGLLAAPSQAVIVSAWSVQPTPNVSGAGISHLSSVSCSTNPNGTCAAVGFSKASGSPKKALAEWWDGMHWAVEPTPNPSGATLTQLNGVSCATPTTCIAVGLSKAPSGRSDLLIEAWNGSSWAIQSMPSRGGTSSTVLNAVSCSTATACMAVGSYVAIDGGRTHPLAEFWDGSSWAPTVPSPAQPEGVTAAELRGVSCHPQYGLIGPDPVSHNCVAVGDATLPSGAREGVVEQWFGGGDVTNPEWGVLPSTNPAGAQSSTLNAVECSRFSESCLMVGQYTTSFGTSHASEAVYSATDATATAITAAPTPDDAVSSALTGVACVSRLDLSSCVGVGAYKTTAGALATMIDGFDGTAWAVEPSPNAAGSPSSDLSGVACPDVCVTVGAAGSNPGTVANTLALVTHGWRTQPDAAYLGWDDAMLNGVTCRVATSCVAVGQRTLAGVTSPFSEVFGGSRWTAFYVPTNGSTDTVLNAVSCGASAACEAVGRSDIPGSGVSAVVVRWNGSKWTIQKTPSPAGVVLTGVSCRANGLFCKAVGYRTVEYGHTQPVIESWNGVSWSLDVPPPASGSYDELNGVSCASNSFCEAVGGLLIDTWNGKTWTTNSDAFGTLTAVSCPAVKVCKAVGLLRSSHGPKFDVGYGEHRNGNTFTEEFQVTDSPLTGVSCPTTTVCYATSRLNDIFRGSSGTGIGWIWQVVQQKYVGTDNSFAAIGCASASSCAAVGYADQPGFAGNTTQVQRLE